MPRATPPRLYWCATTDHDEDWFVVAHSEREACELFEAEEGYDEGDALAELVCDLPEEWRDASPGWPSDELLLACGAEFVEGAPVRVVRIAGGTFAEGDLVGNVAARLRPGPRH